MGILVFIVLLIIIGIAIISLAPDYTDLHKSERTMSVNKQHTGISYQQIQALKTKLSTSFAKGINDIKNDPSLNTAQKEKELKEFKNKFSSQNSAKMSRYSTDLQFGADFCIAYEIKDRAVVVDVNCYDNKPPIYRVELMIGRYTNYFDTKNSSAKNLNKYDTIEITGKAIVYNKTDIFSYKEIDTVLENIMFKKI